MSDRIGLQRGEVELRPYEEGWYEDFEQEARTLRELLGDDVLDIQHVGSTAIPGVEAKPLIDIAIEVRDLQTAEGFSERLEAAGYHYEGEAGVPERRFYAKGPDSKRTHYLHFSKRDAQFRKQITFRDYMRAHPELVKEYNEVKRRLADLYPHDRAKYTSGKDAFIKKVMELAGQSEGSSG